MAGLAAVFDQPGAAFVLLREGQKFPPIEVVWQNKPHSFQEAAQHVEKGGNVGVMAGYGFIGLDQDDPTAFVDLKLPASTMWETRPGRFGLWFRVSDDAAAALAGIGKKGDLAQIKLFKAGQHVGEIKLQRSYQVIPPSWKDLEDGQRAEYKLLQDVPPATISLADLLADLQAVGITFSSRLEANAERLEDMARETRQQRAQTDEQRARRYAEAALADEVRILESTPGGHRNDQLNISAFALGQFVGAGVLSEAEVIAALTRAAGYTGLDDYETAKTIRSGLEAGARKPRKLPEPNPKRAGVVPENVTCSDHEELTEGGNAARLERLHGEDLRYNHTRHKWYVWDGSRWLADSNGAAARLAIDVIKGLYREASEADGKDARNAVVNFARQSDSRRGISNMLALAANRLTFALTANDFDKDRWLLGCENVTIDLRTGEARQPSREDLITKTIGTRYDPSATCPTWLTFLERILPDPDLRRYIMRAVGYCLTGSMAEQAFFFCYGVGSNGKSTFLAVLRALLGEYAAQADFSSFLIQRNERVRNDLAALAGSRLITAIEAEEGSRLSMQAIKAWTGGDPVTARFLFGENFTFQPEGKLWLAANNKPAINERTHAAWRRVHLVPFTVTIPEADRDKEIEQKLLRELPGILNWALEGLREYLAIGLSAPRAVRDATAQYKRENDSLEQFIFECCELGKLKVCKNSELYTTYLNFCQMSGLKALSQHKFSPELNAREGVSSTRSKHGMVWLGIGLKTEWCSFEVKATPLAGDAKGVVLRQNAESFENFPLREDFPEKPTQPTPHIDPKPTPPQNYTKMGFFGQEKGEAGKDEKLDKNKNESCQTPDDPDFRKFKANMAKRRCCLCGRTFPYDLTPYVGSDGKRGYICSTCHMNGPPPEPAKADPQTKLDLQNPAQPGPSQDPDEQRRMAIVLEFMRDGGKASKERFLKEFPEAAGL